MSGVNPFHEAGDNERTAILRPVPGGVAAPPAASLPLPQGLPRQVEPPRDGPDTLPAIPGSPLLIAATPLLQVLGRLRNTYSQPDPVALRARAIETVQAFERACTEANIPPVTMQSARYALCASIDDAVRHTPWGAASIWVQASLVSTFGQGVISGEGFFGQLTNLKKNPAANLHQLELFYLCLSLGYMGQYRLSPRGPAELALLREDLYTTLIRLRGAIDLSLSPHWMGADAPYRPARAHVPVWVMAAGVAVILAIGYSVAARSLGAASVDGGSASTLKMPGITQAALPPSPQPLPPPPPPPPPPPMQLGFLDPEIKAGLVQVIQSDQKVLVRIFNQGMFDSGSATLKPRYIDLLQRIGEALNTERGRVTVQGHTDNVRISTVQFPSNYELSLKRADVALGVIQARLRDPARISARGMSDSQPFAPNDTEKGREQNRRIEIILQREG